MEIEIYQRSRWPILQYLFAFGFLFEHYLADSQIGVVASILFPVVVGLIWIRVMGDGFNSMALFSVANMFFLIFMIRCGGGGLFCLVLLCATFMLAYCVIWLIRKLLCRRKAKKFRVRGILLLSMLLFPAGELEMLVRPADPIVTKKTSMILNYAASDVFKGLRFYEELQHEIPFAMSFGFPRPLRSTGPLKLGQEQVCIYKNGSLIKRCTDFRLNRSIHFEVLEQDLHFERSLHLLGGGYDLEPISARATRVTIETRYRAHLQPRFYWKPIEDWFISQFHGYLIEGLQINVRDSGESVAARQP